MACRLLVWRTGLARARLQEGRQWAECAGPPGRPARFHARSRVSRQGCLRRRGPLLSGLPWGPPPPAGLSGRHVHSLLLGTVSQDTQGRPRGVVANHVTQGHLSGMASSKVPWPSTGDSATRGAALVPSPRGEGARWAPATDCRPGQQTEEESQEPLCRGPLGETSSAWNSIHSSGQVSAAQRAPCSVPSWAQEGTPASLPSLATAGPRSSPRLLPSSCEQT